MRPVQSGERLDQLRQRREYRRLPQSRRGHARSRDVLTLVRRSVYEFDPLQDANRNITEDEADAIDQRKRDGAWVRTRIDRAVGDFEEDLEWIRKRVPAIPSEKPSEVNPK